MTIQEVWQIKDQKSRITKDMTTAQLNEFFANSLREFSKITGKQLKTTVSYIRETEYYKTYR